MKKFIKIMDEINDFTVSCVFNTVMTVIEEEYTDEIVVFINSKGGNVDAQNSIIDLLKSIPNKIVTVNIGCAHSCASTLFINGDKRYMTKNATFNFHPATAIVSANDGNYQDFITTAEKLQQTNDKIKMGLKTFTQITPELIEKGLSGDNGVTLSAEDCIEYKVADAIVTDLTKILS